MKRMYAVLVIAVLAIIIVSCAEKLPTAPTATPLQLRAFALPDTIPVGYGVGLYMQPEGGKAPYQTVWKYGHETVSEKLAATFVPTEVGRYPFWAYVQDAAGARDSVLVAMQCVPLDSVYLPPDTVVLPPDTITVTVPPDTVTVVVVDTVTLIDTTFVPMYIHDTVIVFLPGDTVWQWAHDTTHVFDTIIVIDTVLVPYVVHDTVFVHETDTLYLPPDTIYVPIVDTVTITIYVPVDAFCDTACWEIDWEHYSATVQLRNPAGWYRVIGFDRLRKDPKPTDKEFSITAGGQEFYFSTYGQKYLVEWVGDQGVYLEENAVITIRLKKPEYLPKVAGELCHYYLSGCYWWLVPKNK